MNKKKFQLSDQRVSGAVKKNSKLHVVNVKRQNEHSKEGTPEGATTSFLSETFRGFGCLELCYRFEWPSKKVRPLLEKERGSAGRPVGHLFLS